ncbi:hypothetical protein [Terracidiphilus sp.]|uniref:hypothetical protein n=1 Tax=Terracidiphilus sp. TaxID=1964191 RepID=UPI003C2A9489
MSSARQPALNAAGCTPRIRVDGFRNFNGNLGTVLFTGPEGWPEDPSKSFRHGPAPIDPATRTSVAEWTAWPQKQIRGEGGDARTLYLGERCSDVAAWDGSV